MGIMMTKDEALKMAIEAFELEESTWWSHTKMSKAYNACKEAVKSHFEIGIKSDLGKDFVYIYRLLPDKDGLYWMLQSDLKEALEQPALKDEKGRPMTYWGGLEQPAQEPAGFVVGSENYPCINVGYASITDNTLAVGTPLYTHPHQWQGLTDDERINIWEDTDLSVYEYARVIEQALKEKNTP